MKHKPLLAHAEEHLAEAMWDEDSSIPWAVADPDTRDRYRVRAAVVADTAELASIINDADELEALSVGTILADRDGRAVWHDEFWGWSAANGANQITTDALMKDGAPFTLLLEGDPSQEDK